MSRGAARPELSGPDDPTLVAIVSRPKDWALLETESWYRIPVRSAPKRLDRFRWLGFYQSRAFGEDKWRVNWYARITGIKTATRALLLPDEPANPRANSSYYRIAVDRLRRLERPVPSLRWRRIVFIPTTLGRLLSATEINDLWCGSPIEDELYFRLKDAGVSPERQYFVRGRDSGHMLDLALFCRDGDVDVECDGKRYHAGRERAELDRGRDNALTEAGWRVLRFSGREILAHPEDCLDTIHCTMRRLGDQRTGRRGRRR